MMSAQAIPIVAQFESFRCESEALEAQNTNQGSCLVESKGWLRHSIGNPFQGCKAEKEL